MPFKRKMRPADAPPLTPDEALAKLEHFCAYRERCPQEVRQKIAELRVASDLGEQLYQLLASEKFFDEQRFTEVFVRSKFRGNHWGRVRLRQELSMRAIAPELIEQALAEQISEHEYTELVHNLLQKKMTQWTGDPQAKQKAAAGVIRSGFEPSLVFDLIRKL
jgi:regulatory protein